MAGFKTPSPIATGVAQAITPGGSELVSGRFSQSVAAAEAVGTIGVVGVLPAGCVPVTSYVNAGALGTGFKASFGVLSASGDLSTAAVDGGAPWFVDNTTGAAGGYAEAVTAAFGKVQPVDYDRQLALKLTGAAVDAGSISVNVVYHNA